MTQRRVLKCGKKMQRRRNCEETRCCRNEPRSGFSKKAQGDLQKQFPKSWPNNHHISRVCVAFRTSRIHLGIDYWRIYILPKSATTNRETIVRCDKEVDQGSKRNPRHIRDRLAAKAVAKTDVFSDSVLCIGRMSENPVTTWNEKIDWLMNSFRVEDFTRIHHIADSRRGPKHDDLSTVCT